MGQGVTSRINAAGGGCPCRVPAARGALLVGAAGGADDLLTFRRTLGSPTSRRALVALGEFGTRFGTGAARPVATGGTQRDEPKWRPMLFRRLLLYSAGTGETHWDGGTLLRIRRLGVRIPPSAQKCWSQACRATFAFR